MLPKSVYATVLSAAILLTWPMGVGARPISPSRIAETSGVIRAGASIAIVGLVGAGFLLTADRFVDRSVDETLDRPLVAVVYGLLAYVLVLVLALYANDLLSRVDLAGTPLGYLALAILVGGVLLLSGLGYLLVGLVLTDVLADRRPWQGLIVGVALSALGWVALPPVAAIAAWVVVPAVGIGGPMRSWVHRERTVDAEKSSG